MRKLVLFILLFLFARGAAFSQDQKFHFGLKVIPSMSWVKPDNKGQSREGYRLGFGYGVQTEFRLQENYAICSGVQVVYRGGNILKEGEVDVNNSPLPDSTFNYRMQFLEIPVCLKMMTRKFDRIRYFGQFGFAPGFNLKAKRDSPKEENEEFKSEIFPLNMNMIIGAGVEYEISGSTVAFGGLEFSNGFIDIFKGSQRKGFTNYLGVSAGILF